VNKLVKILIAFGVVIILIVLASSLAKIYGNHVNESNARKVSDALVSEIMEDNSSATYKLFSNGLQSNVTSSAWQHTVAQLASFFGGQEPSLQNTLTTNSSEIEFSYKIRGSDGYYLWDVLMTKNSSWVVQDFNSSLQT
jgi:hypothetical protein